MRFSLFIRGLYRTAWRVVKRARWPTREERLGICERIAEAGDVRAWLRSGKPNPNEVRVRKHRPNALAEKCDVVRPYPEVDDERRRS